MHSRLTAEALARLNLSSDEIAQLDFDEQTRYVMAVSAREAAARDEAFDRDLAQAQAVSKREYERDAQFKMTAEVQALILRAEGILNLVQRVVARNADSPDYGHDRILAFESQMDPVIQHVTALLRQAEEKEFGVAALIILQRGQQQILGMKRSVEEMKAKIEQMLLQKIQTFVAKKQQELQSQIHFASKVEQALSTYDMTAGDKVKEVEDAFARMQADFIYENIVILQNRVAQLQVEMVRRDSISSQLDGYLQILNQFRPLDISIPISCSIPAVVSAMRELFNMVPALRSSNEQIERLRTRLDALPSTEIPGANEILESVDRFFREKIEKISRQSSNIRDQATKLREPLTQVFSGTKQEALEWITHLIIPLPHILDAAVKNLLNVKKVADRAGEQLLLTCEDDVRFVNSMLDEFKALQQKLSQDIQREQQVAERQAKQEQLAAERQAKQTQLEAERQAKQAQLEEVERQAKQARLDAERQTKAIERHEALRQERLQAQQVARDSFHAYGLASVTRPSNLVKFSQFARTAVGESNLDVFNSIDLDEIDTNQTREFGSKSGLML